MFRGGLPLAVRDWAKMNDGMGEFINSKKQLKSLVDYNDDKKWSFKQIAALIERNVERL